MNIEIVKIEENKKSFFEIKSGEIFELFGNTLNDIYIKINNTYEIKKIYETGVLPVSLVNAVNLRTGNPCYFFKRRKSHHNQR